MLSVTSCWLSMRFRLWPSESGLEPARNASYGATSLPNYLRRPYGDGWALVGDAGCHKDPYLALGVCDAFRDAELLTDALAAALSGRRPETEALVGYEERRNAATWPDYARNLHLARGKPVPPEVLAARAQVRGDPEATRMHFLTARVESTWLVDPPGRCPLVGQLIAGRRRSLARRREPRLEARTSPSGVMINSHTSA